MGRRRNASAAGIAGFFADQPTDCIIAFPLESAKRPFVAQVRGHIENERTAMAQHITRQPDGPGKRIGKKGEITGIGPVAPGGAKLFRERLPQIQAERGRCRNTFTKPVIEPEPKVIASQERGLLLQFASPVEEPGRDRD
jgi:hypothetical protein